MDHSPIESLRETQATSIRSWHEVRKHSTGYKDKGFDVDTLIAAMSEGALDTALRQLPIGTELGFLSDFWHSRISDLSSTKTLSPEGEELLREYTDEENRNGHAGMWVLGGVEDGYEKISKVMSYPAALARCSEGVRLMTPGVWERLVMLKSGSGFIEFVDTWLSPRPDGRINMAKHEGEPVMDGHSYGNDLVVSEYPDDSIQQPARFMIVFDPITKSVVPTPMWYAPKK